MVIVVEPDAWAVPGLTGWRLPYTAGLLKGEEV